jgi:hypothetical protein
VRTIVNRLRGKLSRTLVISSAAAVMLGVGLPGAAEAAVSTPSTTVAFSENSHSPDCYRYDYTRDRYHYYEYCYDYSYLNHKDQKRDKRWYDSFELDYWYFKDGHRHYGSCTFDHDFGYDHPDKPWKHSCPSL